MQTELSRDPDGVTHGHQCTATGHLWLDRPVFLLLGPVLDEPRHPASQTRGVFCSTVTVTPVGKKDGKVRPVDLAVAIQICGIVDKTPVSKKHTQIASIDDMLQHLQIS